MNLRSLAKVIVKNLRANSLETLKFDAIFICNGHNSAPDIPKFNGSNLFEGRKMHSHDYRRADAFQGNFFYFYFFFLCSHFFILNLNRSIQLHFPHQFVSHQIK